MLTAIALFYSSWEMIWWLFSFNIGSNFLVLAKVFILACVLMIRDRLLTNFMPSDSKPWRFLRTLAGKINASIFWMILQKCGLFVIRKKHPPQNMLWVQMHWNLSLVLLWLTDTNLIWSFIKDRNVIAVSNLLLFCSFYRFHDNSFTFSEAKNPCLKRVYLVT